MPNTSSIFPDIVFQSISILEARGKSPFDTFLSDLIKQKVPIDAKVSKNQFVRQGNTDSSSKNKKEKIKSMKIKENSINKIRSSLEHNEKDTQQVFQNKLWCCTKYSRDSYHQGLFCRVSDIEAVTEI